METKFCKDCAYCRRIGQAKEFWLCAVSGFDMNTVDGHRDYRMTCTENRSYGQCGFGGKDFKQHKTWWFGWKENPNLHPSEMEF